MAIKRGSKVDIGGSSASMTDLMFLLLIFLMIATTLINSNAIKLDLPKSTAPSKEKVSVVISINAQREFFVGDRQVDFADLESVLMREMENADQQGVSLRADKSVPIEDVVRVINIATDNNFKFNSIQLATRPE